MRKTPGSRQVIAIVSALGWILTPCAGLVFALAAGFATAADAEHPIGGTGTVTVVSYNIRHGAGMDDKLDLERTARVLRAFNADLIALEEVDEKCARSGNVDQAAALGDMLGLHHAFGAFMDYQGGRYGLAVLSRYPIEQTLRHELPPGGEPRCALEVVVHPAVGKPLSFVSIHNDWTSETRRVPQVRALLDALAPRKHPVILAGDFNAEPHDESLKLLAADNWHILKKSGPPATWPADKPRVEIDHVITRGLPTNEATITVIDERVASDHRPIRAIIPMP